MLLYESFAKLKRSCAPGPELKKWAEEAGYVNVTEEVLPVPIGLWPQDKRLVKHSLRVFLFSHLRSILS